MQKLEYEVPRASWRSSLSILLLIALPLIAGASVFLSVVMWVGEPFTTLDSVAVVLVGAPICSIGCAVGWLHFARRRRIPWPLIVPVLLWFAFMLYCSIDLLLPYFQEPWNS
jgi:hypothetical protein